jgi:hypothetical protein
MYQFSVTNSTWLIVSSATLTPTHTPLYPPATEVLVPPSPGSLHGSSLQFVNDSLYLVSGVHISSDSYKNYSTSNPPHCVI